MLALGSRKKHFFYILQFYFFFSSPAVHPASRWGRSGPPTIRGSGAHYPELGLWEGAQARRGRPQPAAHVSAGEESAREATCERQLLGAQGFSLRVCGAEDPSQGPWEPGGLPSMGSHRVGHD